MADGSFSSSSGEPVTDTGRSRRRELSARMHTRAELETLVDQTMIDTATTLQAWGVVPKGLCPQGTLEHLRAAKAEREVPERREADDEEK